MQQLNPDARMKTMTRRPQSAQSQNEQNDGLGGDGIGEDLDENLLTPDEEESHTVIPRKAIFAVFRLFYVKLKPNCKTFFRQSMRNNYSNFAYFTVKLILTKSGTFLKIATCFEL